MKRICFSSGANTSFNVSLTLQNIGWILKDEFVLDFICTNPEELPKDISKYYNVYKSERQSSRKGEFQLIRSYLRDNTPDLMVNLTGPSLHSAILSSLCRIQDIKFIYRYSGDALTRYEISKKRRHQMFLFMKINIPIKIPLRISTKQIAMGPQGKMQLIRHGCYPDNVEILPPPIDRSRLKKRKRVDLKNIPSDRDIILFIGRLSQLKGINDLSTAIQEVLEQDPTKHFVCVGEIVDNLSIPKKYTDNVTITGKVPPANVPAYYNAADLTVLPSYIEGLPRVILESLAVGTPVLARSIADVEYATSNTFDNINEIIDGVKNMKDLPVDSVDMFTKKALRKRYIEAFRSFSYD
jgi:glycosyltransferase involved in cell wall biosynthesis